MEAQENRTAILLRKNDNFIPRRFKVIRTWRIVWKRGIAACIDFLILALMLFNIFVYALQGFPDAPDINIGGPVIEIFFAIVLMCSILIAFSYHLILELTTGYTIGKYLVKIRVVNEEGEMPTVKQILIRNLMRIIEANLFFNKFGVIIGILTILFTRRKQRLGDIFAHTIIIKFKYINFDISKKRRKTWNLIAITISVILVLGTLHTIILFLSELRS